MSPCQGLRQPGPSSLSPRGPAPGALAHSTPGDTGPCGQLCLAPQPQGTGPKPTWGSQKARGQGPSLRVTPSILLGSGDGALRAGEQVRGPQTPWQGRAVAPATQGPVLAQPRPAHQPQGEGQAWGQRGSGWAPSPPGCSAGTYPLGPDHLTRRPFPPRGPTAQAVPAEACLCGSLTGLLRVSEELNSIMKGVSFKENLLSVSVERRRRPAGSPSSAGQGGWPRRPGIGSDPWAQPSPCVCPRCRPQSPSA